MTYIGAICVMLNPSYLGWVTCSIDAKLGLHSEKTWIMLTNMEELFQQTPTSNNILHFITGQAVTVFL